MTNKTKLVFVIASAAAAALFVLMTTHFAVDTAGQALSALAGVLGLEEAPAFFLPGVLVIIGLYLAFRRGRAW